MDVKPISAAVVAILSIIFRNLLVQAWFALDTPAHQQRSSDDR
jgi:hypothetical protein